MALSSPGDPIIDVVDVSKTYGSGPQAAAALRGLSVKILQGEFVSLMGPSGSGKTTLLNLAAGLDMPDSGKVVLGGRDLRTLADHQLADLRLKTTGFVFQAFNLLPRTTAAENVEVPALYSGGAVDRSKALGD